MQIIKDGTITSPKGFTAAGAACGLKKNGKSDLALIVSDLPCNAAGVFTKNIVKGHSLQLTMKNIKSSPTKAVIVNSGNANACVGEQGDRAAHFVSEKAAELLKCKPEEVLFNSTGVIGQPLPIDKVSAGITELVGRLSPDGGHEAAEAIMTTDLLRKEAAVEVTIGGKPVRIGGIAKGSGMIHPNMATMIGLITTDADLPAELLYKALKNACDRSFNRITVDGDTSVCDMVVILAGGKSGAAIHEEGSDYNSFSAALEYVCRSLAVMVVRDGEGATKLIEIRVENAGSVEDAYTVASSIARSPLVKTAFFGQDANWGRILTAAGYSGIDFDPLRVDIYLGELQVCLKGTAIKFDEAEALEILKQKEILVRIDLNYGAFSDRVWTCDFSFDYVKINGSYRT